MRLVLDTNVVFSALLWRGKPYQLLDAISPVSYTHLDVYKRQLENRTGGRARLLKSERCLQCRHRRTIRQDRINRPSLAAKKGFWKEQTRGSGAGGRFRRLCLEGGGFHGHQRMGGGVDFGQMVQRDVGIDLGGFEALMAEEGLDDADVGPAL